MLPGVVRDLGDLRLGDVLGVDAGDAVPLWCTVSMMCVASVSVLWKNFMSTWTTNSIVV